MTNYKRPTASFLALCFIAIIFCFVSFYHQLFELPAPNVINWDVFGYYSWLLGVFNKAGFFNIEEIRQLHSQYPISGHDLYQVMPANSGSFVPIYTLGMAILYFPFFLIAHIFTFLFSGYGHDGLSKPYQLTVVLASVFYAVIGFYYLRNILLKYFSENIAVITLLIIGFGTNYFYYIGYDNGMPHIYLFTLYAAVIWYTILWHETPLQKYVLFIAVLIAILSLARPTECIAVLIPLLYGIYNKASFKAKLRLIKDNASQIIVAIIPAVFLLFLQLLLWKVLLNNWWFNAYAESGHSFDFFKPHIIDGLFSYRKGWLLYTPIMVFAIAGLFILKKMSKELFIPILLFTLLNIYIVLSWHIWWYANSFGMRALIQSYSILAIPLACSIERISNRRFKYPGYIIISLLVVLNLFQVWQFNHKILPKDNNNAIYYWQSFGSTRLDKDAKKYLETNEYLKDKEKYKLNMIQSLDYNDAKTDTVNRVIVKWQEKACELISHKKEFSQGISHVLTEPEVNRLKSKWLNIESNFGYVGDEFDDNTAAKLVFSIDRNAKGIKWVGASFQKYIPERKMSTFSFETKLPDTLLVGDKLNVYLWNTSPDSVYLNSLMIREFE